MTRPFLVATLLLTAPLAAAQSDPWPLVPGNTWTYVFTAGTFGPQSSGASSVTGAATWTALDSVDTAAGRRPRLRVETSGTVSECIVEATASEQNLTFRLLDVAGAAPCARAGLPAFLDGAPGVLVSRAVVDGEVTVGGQTLPGEDNANHYGFDESGTSPRRTASWRMTAALGVTSFSNTFGTSSSTSYTGATLRRATVGGRIVGQPLGSRADFWPRAAGNRWELLLADRDGQPAGVAVWTAEADGRLRLRHVQNGAVTADVTCPLAFQDASPQTGWETRFDLGACALPDRSLAPHIGGQAVRLAIDVQALGRTVAIGGQTVVADEASGAVYVTLGLSGFSDIARYTLARGIGPVRYFVETAPETGPPTGSAGNLRRQWTATLAFARVGSTTYGQQVVADEGEPAAAALALTAGPNPTRGALVLSFTLPAPTEATVEVVDALGRFVLRQALGAQPAGAGSARLDLSGLAAGAYSVRLVGGAVQASVRVSVVR